MIIKSIIFLQRRLIYWAVVDLWRSNRFRYISPINMSVILFRVTHSDANACPGAWSSLVEAVIMVCHIFGNNPLRDLMLTTRKIGHWIDRSVKLYEYNLFRFNRSISMSPATVQPLWPIIDVVMFYACWYSRPIDREVGSKSLGYFFLWHPSIDLLPVCPHRIHPSILRDCVCWIWSIYTVIDVLLGISYCNLTHCGQVTPYGGIDLGRPWLR